MSASRNPYEVREVTVAARPVAGVRAQVLRGHVGREFDRHLSQVYAAARAGDVHIDGQNIFIYRAATPEHLTVDFCVGVTAPFTAVGTVLPLETPYGVAAMTTRALAGPSWEVYGHWHNDPAQLRTDVYYLLKVTG